MARMPVRAANMRTKGSSGGGRGGSRMSVSGAQTGTPSVPSAKGGYESARLAGNKGISKVSAGSRSRAGASLKSTAGKASYQTKAAGGNSAARRGGR